MFVALRENGEYISLVDKGNRNELLELRKRESFICPACQHGLQLKLGTKITYHFAHLKGADCTVKTEPETEYHLRGKKQLFNWMKSQNYQVELEPYLPEISQRPDLLVTIQNRKYAIEFQCSPIDYSLFKKRTDSFKKIGVVPVWILGAKWLKRKSANSISLTSFQWFFARTDHPNMNPTILYYCPESSQFLKVTNITPFTSSEAICTILPLKEGKTTLRTLLEPLNPTYSLTKIWPQKKKKWRIQYSTFPTKTSFLTTLYNNGIPPAHLPAEAGLPVPSMCCFHTPAMIWQMWILLDIIIPIDLGSTFFFSDVMQSISQRIKEEEITIRQLPSLPYLQFSLAVDEFIDVLCNLDIIQKVSRTGYKKIGEISIPTNLEHAFELDNQIWELLPRMSAISNGKT